MEMVSFVWYTKVNSGYKYLHCFEGDSLYV